MTIVAGTGTYGFGGDGGAAASAQFKRPYGLAYDNNTHSLYIADRQNNRIRKINSQGYISTIAGTGASGYNGDGIPATQATLSDPTGLAVDAKGNVYIADWLNNRIRKINNQGIISTIAGTGSFGHSGDGGLATAAQLGGPSSIASDDFGNIYIVEAGYSAVRKIDTAGVISTIAGNGNPGYSGDGGPATLAQLQGPVGIAVDGAGNLYIGDQGAVIRRINSWGLITTIAGVPNAGYSGDNGPATAAQLNIQNALAPLAIDRTGSIYIADYSNDRVRKIVNSASVSISVPQNIVCSGIPVTFTATPTNPGTAPIYQWQVNGVNVGSSSNQFNISTLSTFDVVRCIMTSNIPGTNATTSNSIPIGVNPSVTPSVNIVASQNPANTGVPVTFTASANNGGATPAYQWVVNGANVGGNNSSYTYVPANNDIVSCVLTSNASCVVPATAVSNKVIIAISPQNTPAVLITASRTNICTGTSVSFTATPTNGGTAPVYHWLLNGASVGTNSNQYTSATLANGDVVSCAMTSNLPNISTPTAISNAINMTVGSQLVTPTLNITASQNPVNAGSMVTMVAAPGNGGLVPVYQWKINGVAMPNTGAIYNYTPANGDVVTCVVTSNAGCVSSDTAASNNITLSVLPKYTPAVSIATPQINICAGSSVTFTATPTSGGSAPAYQWKVNGGNVGINSSQYTTTSLSGGDVVSCVMTSNYPNVTGPTATSNSVAVSVNPVATPAVSIVSSQNPVISGTQVTFSATPVNGGSAPVYQWQVNGITMSGSGGATFSYIPANGDVVRCMLLSNLPCANPVSVTSNGIVMTVAAPATPAINIVPSQISICTGESVSFLAVSVNGGSAPVYQWQINGVNTGTNSTQFVTNTLANGDIVTCVMTNNDPNAPIPTTFSNTVTMTVSAKVKPEISIVPSQNPVNAGALVSFIAAPVNGGTAPAYQWKVNGVDVTGGGITYNYVPTNNDIVSCVLTSSVACRTSDTAASNAVKMSVLPLLVPSVSIAPSQSYICPGTQVTFTATPVNGGNSPVYQWRVNGINVGGNNVQYSSATLADGDIVSCSMTSSDPNVASPTAISNSFTVVITPVVTPSVNIIASQNPVKTGIQVSLIATPVNGGTSPAFQWRINGRNVGNNTAAYTYAPSNNDTVTCVLSSNAPCVDGPAVSDPIIMNVISTPGGGGNGNGGSSGDGSYSELYPNPNNGHFTVAGAVANGLQRTVYLDVFNTIGQHVYKQMLFTNKDGLYNQNIELPGIPSGLYFMKISDGGANVIPFMVNTK